MLSLTILGNNSAIPAHNRHPTAQHLQLEDENFLIDCGEGTQMQMSKYKIRHSRINHIFISHLHGDHYFGLPGLLTSMSLQNRKNDLHIHAPAALQDIIQLILSAASTQLSYPIFFHPLSEEGLLLDEEKHSVRCFKVTHRIECWGFLFKQKKKPRKIDPDKVKLHKVPANFFEKLQRGEDYVKPDGGVVLNEELTTKAPSAKSYAYCTDTIYDESLVKKISGADLLYHEATYLKTDKDKAAERFHSTTAQAATIAKKAGVKKLLIGHFSARYDSLDNFLAEAYAVFKDTELALEGMCYKV